MNSAEIAKIAGVSRSTVSKVLHNYPDIPEETKNKVLAVVKQYNYRPNLLSQTLKGLNPKVMGVYLYTTQEESCPMLDMRSPYLMSVLTYLSLEARKHSYSIAVEVFSSADDEDDIVQTINVAFDNKQIGSAVIVGLTDDCYFVERVLKDDRHIIVLDKKIDTSYGARCIFSNDVNAGKRATEHLFSRGYHRVMYISGDLKRHSSRNRCEGYKEAVRRHNENYQDTCPIKVMEGSHSYEFGYAAAEQFIHEKLDQSFDGIIFGTDGVAFGFVSFLREKRPELLDRLGMISFDNDLIELSHSNLISSMSMDYANLAHIVFNLEQNYDNFSGGISLIIEHKLVERYSSLPKELRLAKSSSI